MRQHFAHIMRQHTQQLVLDGVKCNSFSLSQTQPAEKSIFKGPLTKTGLFMPSEASRFNRRCVTRSLASSSSTENGFVR